MSAEMAANEVVAGPVETLTLIRHGFSEANFLQKQHRLRKKELAELGDETANSALQGVPAEFFDRHDSNMRLTKQGVEQAIAAGEWLRNNHPQFDRFYVSPHNRTLETAHHLHLEGEWRVDDRFRERDWGELSSITHDGEDPLTDEMKEAKSKSEWYWRPPSGETLASDVRLRLITIMETLYRKSQKNVVAVSHGELLRVAQFVIEKMTPLSWEAMDKDKKYKIQNCMILQYTTKNPVTGENESNYKWRRAICPWDESRSWDNGEWVRFDSKIYSDDELVGLYEAHDFIFPHTTNLQLPIVVPDN